MPAVNNVYVYRTSAHAAAPILVLSGGRGLRTLGGSYIGIAGAIAAGQMIEVGSPYLVCEGPYAAGNPGAAKTCTRIGASDDDPPRPESDFT